MGARVACGGEPGQHRVELGAGRRLPGQRQQPDPGPLQLPDGSGRQPGDGGGPLGDRQRRRRVGPVQQRADQDDLQLRRHPRIGDGPDALADQGLRRFPAALAEQGARVLQQQGLGHVRADGGDVAQQVGGDLRRVTAGRRDRLLQRGGQRRIGLVRPPAAGGPRQGSAGTRPPRALRRPAGAARGVPARPARRRSPHGTGRGRTRPCRPDRGGSGLRPAPGRAPRPAARPGQPSGGQITGADIGPPHRHRGQHVTGRILQLREMGPDHLLDTGAAQVELEPGLDQVRIGVARAPALG